VDDSGHPDTAEGSWVAAPLRRWRRMTPRERVIGLVVELMACAFGAATFWLLGSVMHDDTGLSGAVVFGVGMFLIYLYQPELTRLVRRMNQ
jgi:hypothetical protein